MCTMVYKSLSDQKYSTLIKMNVVRYVVNITENIKIIHPISLFLYKVVLQQTDFLNKSRKDTVKCLVILSFA